MRHHGRAGSAQYGQLGSHGFVHRRGDADDDGLGVLEKRQVGGQTELLAFERRLQTADVAREQIGVTLSNVVESARADVQAHDRATRRMKCQRSWKADIAESNDRNVVRKFVKPRRSLGEVGQARLLDDSERRARCLERCG